ncbi:MAG: hypothetical protein KFH98_00865 [Gemmatimonadetes bacterium]|nr:hypothetical protein [Gemmatimonadota bacterium]
MTNKTNAEGRRSTTDKVKDKVGDAKDSVKDTASSIAAAAGEKTGHLADEGREKAHEIGDKIQDKAHEIGDTARREARTRADEQKERLTNGIRTIADVLRRGSDDLSADQDQYRPLLNSAAERVEGVSRYLEQRDVDALTNDVRRFAREHTPLFLGGAFVLGFAGARFLKSSPAQIERLDGQGYGSSQGGDRFDRMLPESGTADTGTFEGRSGTNAFQDGGSRTGGSYE